MLASYILKNTNKVLRPMTILSFCIYLYSNLSFAYDAIWGEWWRALIVGTPTMVYGESGGVP